MNGTAVADHDQLVSGFQKMKAARTDLRNKAVTTDFSLDPMPVAAHHTTIGDRLRRKDLRDPEIRVTFSDKACHPAKLVREG